MKKRNIVVYVTLVVVVALGSGLIGLQLGRIQGRQATTTMTEPASESAIVGQEVGGRTIRLFADPQMSRLLYEIDGNRVYRGSQSQGQTILYFDGSRIYQGANRTGRILYAVSGNRIYAGANTQGRLAYTVSGGRIYRGSQTGAIVYNVSRERMFSGANATGRIVFQSNRNLSGNVVFLLPILADQAF